MSAAEDITDAEIEAAGKLKDLILAAVAVIHRNRPLLAPHGELNTTVIISGMAEALGKLAHPMPPEDIEAIVQAIGTGIRGYYQDYRAACPCHAKAAGLTRH